MVYGNVMQVTPWWLVIVPGDDYTKNIGGHRDRPVREDVTMATTSPEFEIVLAVEYDSRESELRADSNQRVLESVAKPTHISYGPWGTTLRWDDADTEVIHELTYLQEVLADYPLLDDSDYSEHETQEILAYAHETGLHPGGLQWLADWFGIDRALGVTDAVELTETLMTCYGELPDGM